jgi:hypothetical protein
MALYMARLASYRGVTCRGLEFGYTGFTKPDMRHVLKRLAAPVLPFALCFATLAFADTNHGAWVRAAMESLPCYVEDRGDPDKSAQLDAIAAAIADVSIDAPRSPREWAALLLTIGYHESTFSLRIQRGQCKPHECDRGRARSAWQLHKNLFTAPVWDQLHGVENTAVQVRAASDVLKRAYFTCSRSGVPWLQATLNGYAGRRCSAQWPGLDQRVSTFARLNRVAGPKVASPKKAGQTSRLAPGSGGPRLAAAAQAFHDVRLAQLLAQRRKLGLGRAAPAQVAQVFGQGHVAPQGRQSSVQ